MPDSFDYWLQRLSLAVAKAETATSDCSRAAFLDLARHYWSMHVKVHGATHSRDFAIPELIDAASRASMPRQRAA